MSVTGSLFRTVLPPSFSTFFNVASMSATSTVMTVFLTSLFRFVSPPLIAPGAVGCRVFWSTSVVPTMWYSIPGYLLMSHPKAFWYMECLGDDLSDDYFRDGCPIYLRKRMGATPSISGAKYG